MKSFGLILTGLLLSRSFMTSADPMMLYDHDGWVVRAHVQAGMNAVSERNLYWSLADDFAAATNYDDDKSWLESYLKPGISVRHTHKQGEFYGMLSAVWSATLRTDPYDEGDTDRLTLEEAHVGYRRAVSEQFNWDLSLGPRTLKLGSGMLLANGGSSGFERGSLKFGPRKAWEQAAIGRFNWTKLSVTAFYLDANEVPSNDTRTTLNGLDFKHNINNSSFVGLTTGAVLTSSTAYPQAAPGGMGPPVISPGNRNGLQFAQLYYRNDRLGAQEQWTLTAEYAHQRNPRINMRAHAARFQLAHSWHERRWRPRLMYTVQGFSGDDPQTSGQERFDPLFFEGSPSSWATGSKSAMTFINSNVRAHQLEWALKPTTKDTVTVRYAHVRADQLRSPIQFGQATRFELAGSDNIVTGVTDPHLADDVFIEYSRMISRNTFLSAGLSVSRPGRGLDDAALRDLPSWTGGFVNLVINY